MSEPGREAAWRALAPAVLIAALYLTLAAGSAWTRRPWCDEGWFANPAYNLLTHGTMGTTVLEPAGNARHPWGIREHTYWITPLHILAQSVWYRVTGFSLESMRAMSIAWGLIGLGAWFQIVRLLAGGRGPALAAAALLCCDFTYVSTASVGRMDMMSAALGSAALAVYFTLRERRFTLAVVSSHCLVAASGLTHPVGGVLAFAALAFLTLRMDRGRLRLAHVLFASLPYFAGTIGWGLYIMQEPGDFARQFSSNSAGRFSQVFSPLQAARAEVSRRYLQFFGLGASGSPASLLKAIVPAVYVLAFAVAAGTRRLRTGGTGTLLWLAGLYVVGLAIFDSTRQEYYLVYSMTALAVVFAVVVRDWAARGALYRLAAAGVACVVVLANVGTLGHRILRLDTMHSQFFPALRFLEKAAPAGSAIYGSGEFGFGLGFDSGLTDDPTLGYYSGKRADFVVVDPLTYTESFNEFRRKDPKIYQHVRNLLDGEYVRVYDRGSYQVYARRQAASKAE